MSKSAVDSYLNIILTTADENLPNTPDNAQMWANLFVELFNLLRAGRHRREFVLTTLGMGQVAVGYPGMTRESPPRYELRERKCLVAKVPTTAISYHLQWKDSEDKSKGFEIVRYLSDTDPGEGATMQGDHGEKFKAVRLGAYGPDFVSLIDADTGQTVATVQRTRQARNVGAMFKYCNLRRCEVNPHGGYVITYVEPISLQVILDAVLIINTDVCVEYSLLFTAEQLRDLNRNQFLSPKL